MKNEKKYVGMTGRTPESRWKSHLSAVRQGSRFRFHAAIRKYGIDAWSVEVLKTSETIQEARFLEETLIADMKTTDKRYGYNAKPGGCGGWIVPDTKYDEWLRDNAIRSCGARNPNAYSVTNDELLALGLAFAADHGYVPGRHKLRRFAEEREISFPKNFTRYRFGGFKNYIDLLVQMSGKQHKPRLRDDHQRELLRQKGIGKRWYHHDTIRQSKQFHPTTQPDGWEIGRKSYA